MTCLPIFGYQHNIPKGVKTISTELFTVLLMQRYEIRIGTYIYVHLNRAMYCRHREIDGYHLHNMRESNIAVYAVTSVLPPSRV